MEQRLVAQQQVQHHPRSGRASTIEPSTGACISPITSSSVKSTAAMGVLNAAASAADAPIGTSAFTLLVLKPSLRPSTEAMPADTCTDGPSRPSAMPLASEMERHAELAQHRAHGDEAIADEQRGLGLGDAATARVGEILRQEDSR